MAGIDKNFERIVSILLPGLADELSKSLRGLSQRPDTSLTSTNTPAPSPYSVSAIAQFFNSDEAGQNYFKSITAQDTESNTLAYKIAAKIQSDVMSQFERDYKMMVHSRIRATAFEASRRTRQASRNGPIYNNLLQGSRLWYNLSGNNG